MAGRFINPFPQFFNSTPTALSGAKLFFYAAGTSTKQNTYSDRTLSSANTNPVVLNSAGYPDVEIWLQDLDYKVVLAPSTDSDPPTSPIWSSDYVRARDSALIAKTLTGSGSPNGSIAGTAGSSSILPDFYWDYTNSVLYVCTTTGTSSTAVWTAVNASSATPAVPPPQGRLSLSSQTPVLTSGGTATTVYYTLYTGNLVPIYNGTTMVPTEFTELTLTLSSSHIASNIYDVFVFSNSGVLTLATGPSWSAGTSGSITAGSCARGTGAGGAALARVKGLWTNAVSMTARNGSTTYTVGANLGTYVGSIFMDGTNGQLTCNGTFGQSRKWGVWNAYNRVPIVMRAGDSTASWSYTTNTVRAANGSSANSITIFSGLAEETFDLKTTAYVSGSVALNEVVAGQIGIGYNSTTAFTGRTGRSSLTNSTGAPPIVLANSIQASHLAVPALGINTITALESGLGATVSTWSGTEAYMQLSAIYRG